MIQIDTFEGAKATVQKFRFQFLTIAILSLFVLISVGCGPAAGPGTPGGDEPAATVNGKTIKMEQVEKLLKAQGRGQEKKMSELAVASARLSILQQLIQDEVLYQKAEKEQTIPSDDDVNAEVNKQKTASGLSVEEFNKTLKDAEETEASWRDGLKRQIALQKLQDKITLKADQPTDSEIRTFYDENKERFKNKRGAELGAIVIDPANTYEGDPTKSEAEAQAKAKEIGARAMSGGDFATLARENSEDMQTRSNGGDWRYFTEDELKQTFGAGVTDYVMSKMESGQIIPQALNVEGKLLIVKLQRKLDKDEDLTLESPGVRQRVTEMLGSARKSVLWQSYGLLAMNEAKVENYLAKKIVDFPNNLSGARPAFPDFQSNTNTTAIPANTNSNTNTSADTHNTNATAGANSNVKPNNKSIFVPSAAPAAKPADAKKGK